MKFVNRRRGTIVFLVSDFEPAVGGTTSQVGLQARELVARGHDVVVVTRRLDRSWQRTEERRGLVIHRIAPSGRGVLAERLAVATPAAWLARHRRQVRVIQPVMWPDAAFAAAVTGLLARTAVIWAIDGEAEAIAAEDGSVLRSARAALRRRVLGRCSSVALTASMAVEIRRAGMARDVTVIPVPVDRERFRPPSGRERLDSRRELGLTPADVVLLFVGHLEARKAVERLLSAVELLVDDEPNVRLLVVGGGRGKHDTEAELRAMAEREPLRSAVTFAGVTDDPRPYFWAADVFVLPSHREGMPNTILEALSCGLPCVAPSSAGGVELLDDEVGAVPESNDPVELAAALRKLISDPLRRERAGAKAVERTTPYGVKAVIDQYEEFYRRFPV